MSDPIFYALDNRLKARALKQLAKRCGQPTNYERWIPFVAQKFKTNEAYLRKIVPDITLLAWIGQEVARQERPWPLDHFRFRRHTHARHYFYSRYPFQLRKDGKELSCYAGVVESFLEYRDACRIWPESNIQLLKMGDDGMFFVLKTNQVYSE